jgi:thymidylate kinase
MSKSDAADPASEAPPARIGRSVALIGIDGAGKSTVAREVIGRLPFDAGYLYMGVNLEASSVMLPTTRAVLAIKRRRGGRSDMTVGHLEPSWRSAGSIAGLRRLIRITNWLAEEAYRAALARRIQRRPAVVVFDRHFFCDYYASAVAPSRGARPLDTRIHGYVLRRWYPRPELTLFLDAPPEVLIARKPGETLEQVARRRLDYLNLASVLPAFEIVDANRPVSEVIDDVVGRIVAFVSGGPIDAGSGVDGHNGTGLNRPKPARVRTPRVKRAAAVAQPTLETETGEIDIAAGPAVAIAADVSGIVPLDGTSAAHS